MRLLRDPCLGFGPQNVARTGIEDLQRLGIFALSRQQFGARESQQGWIATSLETVNDRINCCDISDSGKDGHSQPKQVRLLGQLYRFPNLIFGSLKVGHVCHQRSKLQMCAR